MTTQDGYQRGNWEVSRRTPTKRKLRTERARRVLRNIQQEELLKRLLLEEVHD